MKTTLVLLICATLTACATAPGDESRSSAFPVTIPHLRSSVDPGNGQVEVSITVKSDYREPLKTLRITIAALDASGAKVSTHDEVIEVLGPIVKGQSIGPLEKVTSIQDPNVACVQVVQVQAIKLDYTLDSVFGKDAQAVVTDGSQPCHK